MYKVKKPLLIIFSIVSNTCIEEISFTLLGNILGVKEEKNFKPTVKQR